MNAHKSYAEYGERIVRMLAAERKRRGLTKYRVEQRCGVSQQMVGYIERGLRKPSLEIALRLADGIGVDLAKIITKTRKPAAKGKP